LLAMYVPSADLFLCVLIIVVLIYSLQRMYAKWEAAMSTISEMERECNALKREIATLRNEPCYDWARVKALMMDSKVSPEKD